MRETPAGIGVPAVPEQSGRRQLSVAESVALWTEGRQRIACRASVNPMGMPRTQMTRMRHTDPQTDRGKRNMSLSSRYEKSIKGRVIKRVCAWMQVRTCGICCVLASLCLLLLARYFVLFSGPACANPSTILYHRMGRLLTIDLLNMGAPRGR